jgi:hypothetical protein
MMREKIIRNSSIPCDICGSRGVKVKFKKVYEVHCLGCGRMQTGPDFLSRMAFVGLSKEFADFWGRKLKAMTDGHSR